VRLPEIAPRTVVATGVQLGGGVVQRPPGRVAPRAPVAKNLSLAPVHSPAIDSPDDTVATLESGSTQLARGLRAAWSQRLRR
jgi:hypothetical protein